MSRIVKARSVVDDPVKGPPPLLDAEYGAILKSGLVERGIPHRPRIIPNRDVLTDELNRLKVEIKQSEQKLKALGAELEAARVQAEEKARRAQEDEEDALSGEEQEQQSINLVEQARQQAEQIISQAQAESEQILQIARAEGVTLAEQAKNEGYLEGFSKGFAEATEEFKNENTPKAVMIADILEALTDLQEQTLRENEENMAALAMEVASKILGKAVESDPASVVSMLRAVVEDNKREEYIKITLSPELAAIKAKAGKNVRSLLEALGANVSVVTDSTAAPGTITAETPKGVVDVSIQTQLDNLGAAISEAP